MRYYDIHTHSQSGNPDDVAIVNTIVIPVGVESAPLETEYPLLKEQYLYRWASVGIHPWYIYNVREQITELESLALAPNIVAIGECGLDKLAATPLEVQRFIFKSLALFAEKLRIPLLIHCVKAWSELIEIRKEIKPAVPWIIHGFRGNGEFAKQLLRQGFYLSFGVYYNLDAVRAAWPDCLFAETDDKEVDIHSVYDCLAGTLSLSPELFALQIEKNVQRVFPSITVE